MLTNSTDSDLFNYPSRPLPIDMTPTEGPKNIFTKKPNLGKKNSPSAGRYSPHVSPLPHKPKIPSDHRSSSFQSASTSASKRRVSYLSDHREELLKNYHKCREIMNSAHEAMLLIKEKMLEVKEKVLNTKIHFIESKLNKNAFDDASDVDDNELEEEISRPIIIHGSPEKQNMFDVRKKQDLKKVKIK